MTNTISTETKNTEEHLNLHCFTPRVDIRENADALFIDALMPGVNPQDINIHLKEGILTILGQVTPSEIGNKLYSEYEVGNFERSFRISDTVDKDKISANISEGILSLILPKSEAAKPRQIPVNIL